VRQKIMPQQITIFEYGNDRQFGSGRIGGGGLKGELFLL